jgi:hypothetical protein
MAAEEQGVPRDVDRPDALATVVQDAWEPAVPDGPEHRDATEISFAEPLASLQPLDVLPQEDSPERRAAEDSNLV